MAAVDQIILEITRKELNLAANHIQCFCHKITLILLVGLNAVNFSTKVLALQRHGALGFVPVLGTVEEIGEEFDDTGNPPGDVLDRGPIPGGSDCESDDESKVVELAITLSQVLIKVDLVIQGITSSAASRSEFNLWRKKLDYNASLLVK